MMQTQRRMGGVYGQALTGPRDRAQVGWVIRSGGPRDLPPGMKRDLASLHRRGNDVIAARPLFPITTPIRNR